MVEEYPILQALYCLQNSSLCILYASLTAGTRQRVTRVPRFLLKQHPCTGTSRRVQYSRGIMCNSKNVQDSEYVHHYGNVK